MKPSPDLVQWCQRTAESPQFEELKTYMDRLHFERWRSASTTEDRERAHAEWEGLQRFAIMLRNIAHG